MKLGESSGWSCLDSWCQEWRLRCHGRVRHRPSAGRNVVHGHRKEAASEVEAVFPLSGTLIDVSPDWIEREQMTLPPSPRLARFAPQVTFLEFMALENPKMHSALRIATTTNPFLGDDEVALDVQMHSAAGSGNGLGGLSILFFLFAAAGLFGWRLGGLQESKEPSRITGSDDGFAEFEYSHRLQTRPHAGGFLFKRVEPGRIVSSHEWSGGARAGFTPSSI